MDYEVLVGNIGGGKVRHATLGGRDHLVVPIVILPEEGVLEGSDGPGLYPKAENKKSVPSWNHKPLVLDHPTFNGMGISASDPEIMDSRQLGVALKTKYKDSLVTEGWFDVENTNRIHPEIIPKLERNEKIEVSTGLYFDREIKDGDFNGKKYEWIARNYRPDHIAVLMDREGACSVKDGCGCLATNAKDEKAIFLALQEKWITSFSTNKKSSGLSHQDVARGLNQALNKEAKDGYWPGYIEDVYDNFFVYSNKGELYQRDYTVGKSNNVQVDPNATQVMKKSEYRTLDGKPVAPVNADVTGSVKPFLPGVPMSTVANAAATTPDVPAATPPVAAPAPVVTAPVVNCAPQPAVAQTMDQYIANAPAGVREPLNEMIQNHNADKQRMVAVIVANKSNTMKAEELVNLSFNVLKSMAAMAGTTPAAPIAQGQMVLPPNYGGAGSVAPVVNAGGQPAEELEPLGVPVYNWNPAQKN